MVVPRGLGQREKSKWLFNGFWDSLARCVFPEISCTTIWTYLTWLNCTVTDGWDVTFLVITFSKLENQKWYLTDNYKKFHYLQFRKVFFSKRENHQSIHMKLWLFQYYLTTRGKKTPQKTPWPLTEMKNKQDKSRTKSGENYTTCRESLIHKIGIWDESTPWLRDMLSKAHEHPNDYFRPQENWNWGSKHFPKYGSLKTT